MAYKRIVATFVGDTEYKENKKDRIVFLIKRDENNKIVPKSDGFGYLRVDNDKYPFYLEFKKDKFIFNFGATDGDIYTTNLSDKKIIVNEFFTYTTEKEKMFTYRIESII